LVTHDLEEAVFTADRIGIMYGSPAELEVVENPWRMPRQKRMREARATTAFAEAVTTFRRRFEEIAHAG
jgi:ABC-type nitrate/sulfonate/bicarbonate transport system ATPase subunit